MLILLFLYFLLASSCVLKWQQDPLGQRKKISLGESELESHIMSEISCSLSQGQKPKYACVVSVGCGIYPPEKLENVEKVLLGLHWLNPLRLKEKIKMSVKLMLSAVSL